MESEPRSVNGKRAQALLSNLMGKFPERAMEKLKRALIFLAAKIKNEDSFLGSLYGQDALDATPLNLRQHLTTTLLRVQHAIEFSCDRKKIKELVVAFEMSENENILMEISNWAEKNCKGIAEGMESQPIDLAPQRLQRCRPLSQLTSGMKPRHRKIDWTGEKKECWQIEVCRDKIIVGWNNGQIKIYNSKDLHCETVLSYCKGNRVTGFQCTCKEIIAAYNDGNMCVWNIENGTLVQTVSITEEIPRSGYVSCMRWRNSKLVVGTMKPGVQIWQYYSSVFTLLGSWNLTKWTNAVDFNEDYIFLLQRDGGAYGPKYVDIFYFNGQCLRSITLPEFIECMSPFEGYVVTGVHDNNRVLRIWEISTEVSAKELEGHEYHLAKVNAQDGVIVSADRSGRVIFWSAEAARQGRPAQLASFTDPAFEIGPRCPLKLGQTFVVRNSHIAESITVTDFSS